MLAASVGPERVNYAPSSRPGYSHEEMLFINTIEKRYMGILLLHKGNLTMWGDNQFGQLGVEGMSNFVESPETMSGPGNVFLYRSHDYIFDACAGYNHGPVKVGMNPQHGSLFLGV